MRLFLLVFACSLVANVVLKAGVENQRRQKKILKMKLRRLGEKYDTSN